MLLYAVGLALLAGRLAHAANISSAAERIPIRVVAVSLTFAAIAAGAIANLVIAMGMF
jgi:uncharacterized membrane protein YecN with MAPEG domain